MPFLIGVPTLTFQLLTSLSIALINREANGYGDAAITGMGAVTRVTSMGTLVVFGFLKGFQPIAGFSYGAKKFQCLREAIKISILWSTVFCVVVGLLIALFSVQIISQFANGNTEMIAVGQKSLLANGFSFFLFGFYTVYTSLQLIPVNMIAYRSQYGSANPAGIIAPAIVATFISTLVVVYCKGKGRRRRA